MRIRISAAMVPLVFGCLGPSVSIGADRVKICLAAPLSGPSKALGLSIRAAVQFAINDINAKDGVLGRDFELNKRVGAGQKGFTFEFEAEVYNESSTSTSCTIGINDKILKAIAH